MATCACQWSGVATSTQSRDLSWTSSRKSWVLASNSLNPRWRITSVARLRWEPSTSQPRVNVSWPAFTLGPDSLTTCKLRLCGLPMPTMPMTRRSLADDFLTAPSSWAARSCRAYQVGNPAAASDPRERWRKPRREKFPFTTFSLPFLPVLDRGEPSRRFPGDVLSAEDPLSEIIEVVPPFGRVVAMTVDVPDVRDILLLEI